MKNLLIVFTTLFFVNCGHKLKLIGTLNIVGSRNVSLNQNYTLIKSYAGMSNKEIKRTKANNIENAISNLVRTVPGGEFLQNCKIYVVDLKYYCVEGDVYGLTQNANVQGFKKGDRVMWKDNFVKYTGVISDLSSEKEATVKQDENGKIRVVRYSEMTRIE